MRDKGPALINVTRISTIGAVQVPSRNGAQSEVVSPGQHVGVFADCVLRMKEARQDK